MTKPVFKESDRAELQARLLLIARKHRDPKVAREAVLQEIFAWVKQSSPLMLSRPLIEEIVLSEYRMHEVFLQEQPPGKKPRTDRRPPVCSNRLRHILSHSRSSEARISQCSPASHARRSYRCSIVTVQAPMIVDFE
jgi:hypothetical protein